MFVPGDGESHPSLRDQFVDTGKVALHYAEGPRNGPPVIMLHGIGQRWQAMLGLIPDSLPNQWVLAPDFRGHGLSGKVPRGYSTIGYAQDIIVLLRERVDQPTIIHGHSLGGMVAMWIAAIHPELVRALILSDNVMSEDAFSKSIYPRMFEDLREVAAHGGSLENIADRLAKVQIRVPMLDEAISLGDIPGNDHTFLLWWARNLQQLDPEIYTMTLDGSSTEGWEPDALLAHIECPTLLLQANPELGGLMSDGDVIRAQRLLKHSSAVRCPTLGHAMHMQQPGTVLRAVQSFLAGLPR
jgi:pimeloyl-ACP methyl ester carboxylesterase